MIIYPANQVGDERKATRVLAACMLGEWNSQIALLSCRRAMQSLSLKVQHHIIVRGHKRNR